MKTHPLFGRKQTEEHIANRREGTLKGAFKKSHVPWNKGIPCPDNVKEKVRKQWTIKKRDEQGIKMKENNPMKALDIKLKSSMSHKGQKPWNKGIPMREESKQKARLSHKDKTRGEKNGNWLGGKSFEPYGLEFNNNLKEQIRQRDGYRCQECFRHQNELHSKFGKRYKLIIHHIDYNKQNNNLDNLISLCRNCHNQTNYSRDDWMKYFKEQVSA